MPENEKDVIHTHRLFKRIAGAMKEYVTEFPDANISPITVTVATMFLARIIEIHAFELSDSVKERERYIDENKHLVMKAFDMLKTQSTFKMEDEE